MTTYTLTAGRSILRDGVPFATVNRSTGPNAAAPEDVDTFARLATLAPAMVDTLQRIRMALQGITDPTGTERAIRTLLAPFAYVTSRDADRETCPGEGAKAFEGVRTLPCSDGTFPCDRFPGHGGPHNCPGAA